MERDVEGADKGKLHWGKVVVGCGMEGVATSTALGTPVSLVCSLALNPIKCSMACLHVMQLILLNYLMALLHPCAL